MNTFDTSHEHQTKFNAETPSTDSVPESAEHSLKKVFLGICWFFTGLGVYRAWIEICFVGTFVPFPEGYCLRDLFDLACIITLLSCVIASRQLSPLTSHVWAKWVVVVSMTASAAMGFAVIWFPQLIDVFAIPASLLGGVGVGFMILFWSELYGCLNPIRIALYYALSQLVGAFVIWTFKGFELPWLAVYTCALPAISLGMLYGALGTLPVEQLPHRVPVQFSFPWKPVAMVCVYSFAFGLQESHTYAYFGPHSGFGMITSALIVCIGILILSRWIDFGAIYSLWLPVMMMVPLLLSLVGSFGDATRGYFISLSYGAAELFMMTMIGSIVYRYGASAVWIFGIERAVRMVAMACGRAAQTVAHGWLLIALVSILAVIGFVIIVTECKLTSDWGIEIHKDDALYETALRNALGRRCAELGREKNLTQREEEVLLLLAQHKTASDIENELCVAHGTAKAHIRHVYRKLDIHSRDELFSLVYNTDDKREAPSGSAH